jgi:hypothetical protein
VNGDQPDGTLDRLNFIGGDNPGDRPVIAAFPTNLPMAPGQTFPFGVKLDEVADSVKFPLLGPWARSLLYIKQHNKNQSVTLGGPLFHIPDEGLPLPEDGIDPFRNMTILPHFPADPVTLTPASTTFELVTETINTLSDATWRDLGGRLGPLPLGGPPQNAGGNTGITPEQIKTIFELQNRPAEKSLKEREQAESAAETEIFYKLMFGALPAKDSTTPDQIVLATIQEPFKLVLQKNRPVTAAATFRGLVGAMVEKYANSDKASEKAATFDKDAITTRTTDCFRSCHWLDTPLSYAAKKKVDEKLGIIHFLTPNHAALQYSQAKDAVSGPVALALASDQKAQFEASKESTMYVGGCLQLGSDVHHAICNLHCLSEIVVTNVQTPLVLQKLRAYTDILDSHEGRRWLEAHRNNIAVAVHLFQDCQHILTLFVQLATKPLLQVAAKAGENIACDNYHAQASIADCLINKLFAIVSGNSLGEFCDPPVCLGWFQAKQEKSQNNMTSNNTRDRSSKNAPGTPDLLHDNKKPRPN